MNIPTPISAIAIGTTKYIEICFNTILFIYFSSTPNFLRTLNLSLCSIESASCPRASTVKLMVSKTMHKYTPRILIAKVIFKILFVSDDFTIPSIILDVISNSLLYFSIKYLLFSLNHFSIYLDSKFTASL